MDLLSNINYRRALEYIATTDLTELDPGKHELDGENLFVNIVDSKLKTPVEARLEAHDRYIDIQVPLSCAESFGVKPRALCMQEGEFDTAHAPLIGEGMTHKAIFKVKVV